jgi:hypothetical protein
MPEWWSYSLSDFLLFSPRTYYRLLALYNAAIWPAQIAALGFGLVILLLIRRSDVHQGRVIAAILAACWLWVGWAYHWQRYATINWGARYFAAAFALEALLIIAVGVIGGRLVFRVRPLLANRMGLGIFVFALAVEPLIGLIAGRDWKQAEIFGIAPDPTAVATLGALLLADGRARWSLLVIPLCWLTASGATLLAMHSPEAFVLLAIAVLALTLAFAKSGPTS